MWEAIVGGLVGAVFSAFFVMWLERKRKPKLGLNIEKAGETDWGENQVPRYVKVLTVGVKNSQLCCLLRPFMHRNAADHCYGNVFFYEQSGKGYASIFDKIEVKWKSFPALLKVPSGNLKELTSYEVRYNDIHPGETELIDIVAKYDSEEECYVWCYDSYSSKYPRLKNPYFRISNKEFFVYVDIRFAGQHLNGVFKVTNGVSREQFELLNVSDKQEKEIKEEHRRLFLESQR